MKKVAPFLITSLFVLLVNPLLKSQDTLYMKNGTKIPSKVLEITPSEVKYKKTDNPDGPTFTTLGSDINLIKYANGTIDSIRVESPVVVVEKIPEKVSEPRPTDPYPALYPSGPFFKYDGRRIKVKDAQDIMLKVNDPEINKYVKAAKVSNGLGFVGFVAIPTFLFGAGYSVYAFASNRRTAYSEVSYGPGIASGVVAVGCLATSITFNVRKKYSMKKALNIYNEKY